MIQPTNILISGGWGYGNLGDDAILLSTIKLTRSKFPNAKLHIFSYSPNETKDIILDSNCELHSSVHRLLFGKSAFRFLHTYKKSVNMPYTIKRISNRIKHYLPHHVIKPDFKALKELEYLFAEADMFIMSGGGYFNNWRESLISRCTELQLAQRFNVTSFIIGQTLDDFQPIYRDQVKSLLSKCNGVSVRDTDSFNMLKKMGLVSTIAPDLVLAGIDVKPSPHPKNEIVFIPAELPLHNTNSIIQGIADFAITNGLIIRIAITRLYNADVRCARKTLLTFRNQGVKADLDIPNNFNDVAKHIIGAKFVISRNLHGLILGYIGGANVISLHNAWKFKGFLNQINAADSLINIETDNITEIADKLNAAYNYNLSNEIRVELMNIVTKNFNSLISLS